MINNMPETTEITSPLYGAMSESNTAVDMRVLQDTQLLRTLKRASSIYQEELAGKDYTPLTINSYSSAINRFLTFLEVGQVIPDYENKPTHRSR